MWPWCKDTSKHDLAHKLVLSSESIGFKKVRMEVETETEEPLDLMEWWEGGWLQIYYTYSYLDAYKFSMDSCSTITSVNLQLSVSEKSWKLSPWSGCSFSWLVLRVLLTIFIAFLVGKPQEFINLTSCSMVCSDGTHENMTSIFPQFSGRGLHGEGGQEEIRRLQRALCIHKQKGHKENDWFGCLFACFQ